jgi:hypothetical protein
MATLWIFTQNSDNHFCCLTSSNVLFIQLLAFCRNWEQRSQKNCIIRHKTASINDGLPEISKMKYRILEPGTTISGFADNKKIKIKNESRPTDPRFFWHVTVNTHIFFLAVIPYWTAKTDDSLDFSCKIKMFQFLLALHKFDSKS